VRGGWSLLVSLAGLVGSGSASAIDLDRLVMPGPLIEAHARFESECSKYHRPLERGGQDALCLDCHDDVDADRKAGRGFHGRSPAVARAEACRTCHPDHRGRDADVTGLFAETFEHRFTDYPLDGAHATVPCGSCHPAAKAHRDAPHDCVACHRDDDPHGDSMSDDCADCHRTSGWREARFDHDRTRFPLRGAHRETACALCHPGPDPKDAPEDCVGCHRLDDAHRGRLGADCAACHGVVRWAKASFDHGRDTSFPLEGAHAGAECVACHAQPPKEAKTPTACVSCHRSQDVHAGRNGEKCESCHVASDWARVAFDHDRDTHFALVGAHRELRCAQCHGTQLEGLNESPTCVDCHRADDVHAGSLESRCDLCHTSESWGRGIVFEHDVVRFPLLGMHATASCEQCHPSRRFDRIDTACRSCHAREDAHGGALGEDCGLCHGPNGWDFWEFDHDTQTGFALHGAHEDLACSSCHRADAPRLGDGAGRCILCHADQDVHFGAFGESCEACHVDTDWRVIRSVR